MNSKTTGLLPCVYRLREMKLVQRAYDVWKDEGVGPLLSAAVDFLGRTVAPRRLAIAGLTRQAKILDRETFYQYSAETARAEVFQYANAGSVTIRVPQSVGRLPSRFSSVCGEYQYDRPFVSVIEDGRILQNGLATTPEYSLILDAAHSRRDRIERYFVDHPRELWAVLDQQRRAPPVATAHDYDLACSLIPNPIPPEERNPSESDTKGFAGHMMTILTSLQGLARYRQRTGKHPTLLYHRQPPSYVLEMIELVGLDPDQLVVWDGEPKQIRELVVPSVRRQEHNISFYQHRRSWPAMHKFVPPEACAWVRETARKQISEPTRNIDFAENILLSRSDANQRRIRNNDELARALAAYGFETYTPGNMPLKKQAQLFLQAETVVSPHGAGLANLLFAEDCSVVEIFGSKTKPTFFMLAGSLGHSYGFVRGTAAERDIRVDVPAVVEMVEKVTD